jgi:hypothetical protein
MPFGDRGQKKDQCIKAKKSAEEAVGPPRAYEGLNLRAQGTARPQMALLFFFFFFFLIFWWDSSLNSEVCTWKAGAVKAVLLSHTSSPFCSGYFGDRVS